MAHRGGAHAECLRVEVGLEDAVPPLHARHAELLLVPAPGERHAQAVVAGGVIHHVAVDGHALGEAGVERDTQAEHLEGW